jgi:hypothetical protein
VYDGDGSGATHLAGLIDIATIQSSLTREEGFTRPSLVQTSLKTLPSLSTQIPVNSSPISLSEQSPRSTAEMHFYSDKKLGMAGASPKGTSFGAYTPEPA